jgi:hypothetical protein
MQVPQNQTPAFLRADWARLCAASFSLREALDIW